MNGDQLYGLRRRWVELRMSGNPELKGFSLKQKLTLGKMARESKMTLLDGRYYSNTFTPYWPSPAYDRFMRGLKSLAAGKPCPVVVNFGVTTRCCCNCWHCSFADRNRKKELSLDELKKAISGVQDLGAAVIGLTGGEPLLREDLEDVVASIGERSMPLLFTTGYKLDSNRVQALKKAGLGIPVISLDHYNAEKHDQGRRRSGMHKYALKAIRLFQEAGFYTAVSFVPNRALVDDREEIYKVIEFFRTLGVNDMRLTSPILAGHLTAHPEEKLTPDNVKTICEIQRFCTRNKGYPGVFAYDYFEGDDLYGCGAGFNYMFIDAEGNACPCDFTMLSLGNIRDKSLDELWRETSEKFRQPGLGCYANKCAQKAAALKTDAWPLKERATLELLEDCPPFEPGRLPGFYKRLGSISDK